MGLTVLRLLIVVFATFSTPSLVAQEKIVPQKSPKPPSDSGERSGYVWADNPISKEYTPSTMYSFNSRGKITIRRHDVGRYSVLFAGLGGRGGNALVTAYGGGSEICKVQWFGSDKIDPTTFVVGVYCFDINGKAVDTTYTARVMWAETAFGRNGYAFADNSTSTSSYTPSAMYSYNSSGGVISIQRLAEGSYAVRFAGLGGRGLPGGNVLVTAYGGGNETCKVERWDSGGADFIATVRCNGSNGKPVDSNFSINVVW